MKKYKPRNSYHSPFSPSSIKSTYKDGNEEYVVLSTKKSDEVREHDKHFKKDLTKAEYDEIIRKQKERLDNKLTPDMIVSTPAELRAKYGNRKKDFAKLEDGRKKLEAQKKKYSDFHKSERNRGLLYK